MFVKVSFRNSCDCNNFVDINASLIRKTKNKKLKNIIKFLNEKKISICSFIGGYFK